MGGAAIVTAAVVLTSLAVLVLMPRTGIAVSSTPQPFARTIHGPLDPAVLSSPNAQEYGEFGEAVAAGSGTIVVGAPGEKVLGNNFSGRVYLYSSSKDTLTQTLQSPNSQYLGLFGYSVAVSGKTVAIGAPWETVGSAAYAGRVYLFSTSGHLLATLASPSPQLYGYFGLSVAISGSKVLVGAPGQNVGNQAQAGCAYVYSTSGALIASLESPKAQYYGEDAHGFFGYSVALSGTTAVVGAPSESAPAGNYSGHAYLFKATNGALLGTLTSPNAAVGGGFGYSVAISGTTVAVGAPGENASPVLYAGHAYLFNAKSQALLAELTGPVPQENADFGLSIAISGSSVVVGAPYENVSGTLGIGIAYTFSTSGSLTGTLNTLHGILYGEFGWAVAVSGPVVVVSALGETADGQASAGNVYVF